MNKKTFSFSIRYALPLLFALLILSTAVIVGTLAFSRGQDVVNDMSTRLAQETTARIEQHVLAYLDASHVVLEMNAAAARSGKVDFTNLEEVTAFFWQQVRQGQGVSFLSYGNEQGEFVAVEMTPEGGVLRLRDETTAPERMEYRLNAAGQPEKLLKTQVYDPRERDWYQTAVSVNASTWSDIYQLASRPELAISPVRPLTDENGQTVGVLASILTLQQISDFLQALPIGETGEAYIMERNGSIVASSVPEPPFVTDAQGGQERLMATASSNALIKETAAATLAHFQNTGQTVLNTGFLYTSSSDEKYYIQAATLKDGRGLDWIIVVVIPQSDYLGPITARVQTTFQVALLAVVAAVGIGIGTARWIIRPILALGETAVSVEQGIYDLTPLQPIEKRSDELGSLARVFRRMAQEVKEREDKLKQQVQKLKIEIDEAKSQKRVQEIVESDFFKFLEASAEKMRQRRHARRQQRPEE
ncbi:MAG: HAMP domain-containing protein [Candidatus Thermofonsia bacterium]|nr:MAG: HAMP domain-containing protein [Candidatus Thermofonsia bacterium]